MEIIISKLLVEQCAVNLQPSKHESWWRRLEDAWKMSLPLSSEDIFKTSWSRRKIELPSCKIKKNLIFSQKIISYIWEMEPSKKLFIFSGGNFLSSKNKNIHSEKMSSLKKKLLNFLAPKILIIIETGCFSNLYLLVLKHPIF